LAIQQQTTNEVPVVRKAGRRLVALLVALLAASELFYLLIVALSPLPSLHLSDTPLQSVLPWTLVPFHVLLAAPLAGSLQQHPTFSSILLGATFLALVTLYAGMLLAVVRLGAGIEGRRWLLLLLGGALLFGVTLLFQPKLFSDDVFTYIFSGRILSVYGADPLNTAPIRYPADPYFAWVLSGRNEPNIYGPLWLCVVSLLARISAAPTVTLLLFKGFALLTHLLCCLLIWTILGEIAPTRRVLGTLLYAWNPLAVIELAGGGHNEGFLMVLLLSATWLYIRFVRGGGRGFFACTLVVCGLAISTNLLTLLLVPFYLWFDLRTERAIPRAIWKFCLRMLLVVVPAIVISLPFWRGATTFFAVTSAVDIQHFVHSPVGTLDIPIRAFFQFVADVEHFPPLLQPITAADVTLRASALFIFALIYAHLFSQVRYAPGSAAPSRQQIRAYPLDSEMLLPGFDVLFRCCGVAIFWYLILVSGWFWPWYILWLLWTVTLRRLDAFTSAIVIVSGTALFLYPFVGFTRGPIATYQAALIFGIPLVYLVVSSFRQRFVERNSAAYERRSETTQD
jgi:hypothetical protein